MAVAIDYSQYEIPKDRVFFGHPVKVPLFEGPLDLLLYLVRREQVDIYEIPISKITEQYLGYLALLDSMNIEVAGDFLVMAATLMEIKSRSLLPRPPVEEELEDEEDPQTLLIARLLEYKRYKEAASSLDELAQDNRFALPRPTVNGNGNGNHKDEAGYVIAGDVTPFHLWAAFQEVLSRAKETATGEIIKPRFTVAMKIAEIASRLKRAAEGLSFFSLFPEGVTKLEVIITFLALLELIRMGRVRIAQPKAFSDIQLHTAAG